MVSLKRYRLRLFIAGVSCLAVVATIFAFFISLGRGHLLNCSDVVPWIGGVLIAAPLTFVWVKSRAKSLRERESLWGPSTS